MQPPKRITIRDHLETFIKKSIPSETWSGLNFHISSPLSIRLLKLKKLCRNQNLRV